jgi:hypothetical protein
VRQTQGGSYVLEEMDGSELLDHVAAYRLIPYVQRQDLDQWANRIMEDNGNDSNISQEPSDDSNQEATQDSDSDSSAH